MMNPGHDSLNTSLSLLAALRNNVERHEAWGVFVGRYGPRIERWCRKWGLQEADVSDVTQNVLLQLARQMETFEYDRAGRFRAWLKTVTWRAWADFLKARSRNPAQPGSMDQFEHMQSLEAKDDLNAALDDEANREILEIALDRVRSRVEPHTFDAFRLMVFDGLSGAQAAERLGIKTGSAFVAKSRVDRMLSEEVDALEKTH